MRHLQLSNRDRNLASRTIFTRMLFSANILTCNLLIPWSLISEAHGHISSISNHPQLATPCDDSNMCDAQSLATSYDVRVHITPRSEPRVESCSKTGQKPDTCRGFRYCDGQGTTLSNTSHPQDQISGC